MGASSARGPAPRNGALFALDPGRDYPVLVRGEGVRVWDRDGREYLDAIAGIAVATVGYGRTEVAEAMAAQAARLPYAVGNIFANEPSATLAERLVARLPADLSAVHFASGGSEAVEIALKLARQVHVVRGEPERTQFIGRRTSYHGATLAGLSVGGSALRRKVYEPLLMPVTHIPPAYCWRCPFGLAYPSCELACAEALEAAIEAIGAGRVAAFILEPIVASVGGAIPAPPGYLRTVREICDRHGILLIADEIVTGFGRTGRAWGVDHDGVVPDLLVMGKGIAGGYAALSGVAIREPIVRAFRDSGTPFEHIFTFGAQPVAAAAGLAVLDIVEREQVFDHVVELEPVFRAALEAQRRFRFVGDVRATGFMGALEFVADPATREPFPPATKVAVRVREAGLANGIVLYPGTGMADGTRGDVVSLYPPLVMTATELAELRDRLEATLDRVARDLGLT